jgi:hypothetical protein
MLDLPPDTSPARSPSQCSDKMSRDRTRCWLQKSPAARLDTSCGFGRPQDVETPWRLDGRASTDSSAHDEDQAVFWLCAPHTGTRQKTGTGPHATIRTWPCGLPRGGPISLDTKVPRNGSRSHASINETSSWSKIWQRPPSSKSATTPAVALYCLRYTPVYRIGRYNRPLYLVGD